MAIEAGILGVILNPIVSAVEKVVTRVVPDKTLQSQLVADITKELLVNQRSELENQTKVVLAEIGGESWLQRNWRPILMLTIVTIVANNYIMFPYITLFGFEAMLLELPDKLWNLMTVGVGGYVVGRSAEKVATSVAEITKGAKG